MRDVLAASLFAARGPGAAGSTAFEALLWMGGVFLLIVLAVVTWGLLRQRLRLPGSAEGPLCRPEELRRLRDAGHVAS